MNQSKRVSYPENLSESSIIYMHAEDDDNIESPYSPYDSTVRYSKKFRPTTTQNNDNQRTNTCCGYRYKEQFDDYDVDFNDILKEQKVNLITN